MIRTSYIYFIIFNFIVYGINLISLILLGDNVSVTYGQILEINSNLTGLYILVVLLFIFTVIYFSSKLRFIFFSLNKIIYFFFSRLASPKFTIFISIISGLAYIILLNNYGLYSRFSGDFRISNTGITGLIYSFSTYYVYSYLILDTLYHNIFRIKRTYNQSLAYFLAIVSWMPGILNGTLNTILFIIIISSNIYWLREINLLKEIKTFLKKLKISIKIILLSVMTSLSIAFVATSNNFIKSGMFTFEFIGVIARFTTHSLSLLSYLNQCNGVCLYYEPLNAIIWRLSYFFDSVSYASESIINSSRINAMNTFSSLVYEKLINAGSSPGPIASMFLINPLIIGILITLLISSYFLFNISLIFDNKNFLENSKKIFPFIIFYLLFHLILNDPLDLLIIFTPNYVPLILLSIYATKAYYLANNIKYYDE